MDVGAMSGIWYVLKTNSESDHHETQAFRAAGVLPPMAFLPSADASYWPTISLLVARLASPEIKPARP
jgi:hypothetical protein